MHNILHLGYLHIPVFSAFVAAGLVAALLLSQRTAPLAGIAPDAMWDTGMIAASWGVEWCVVGLDRDWAYNPRCKMARP